MGTWGSGSFENDLALDWVADVVDEPTVSKVEATLRLALEADDPDDVDSSFGLAAAELVAAAVGCASPDLPADSGQWAEPLRGPLGELVDLALRAVGRIGTRSERAEIMAEAGLTDEWQAELGDLARRLRCPDRQGGSANPT